MEPWYRVVTPRKEVREGRSFNPDEFAIALEQVVAGTAPVDYRDPKQFFARTCVTRALREHAGMVLRRLSGRTENTAPVLTLITQFGGGKTHTLTALYHLARAGQGATAFDGVADLLAAADLEAAPEARVGVFVGNAWDPREGRETPWIDLAAQLAGDAGVAALGPSAKTTPPGTDSLARVFAAAGGPVLVLFDEVLNFINRHRSMADSFHAFIQNLTVAMTGTSHGAAVISLPRSQVEMTESDMQWQEKITKVVRRVAKDLIANDETEISEVIRRRLFEDLGGERLRKSVAATFADWCFERRAQLPPEWTAVDTASTEKKSREFLQLRFEACYPFHPATLSVFQRKWQALPQFQQTRGTLAMLAQWVSWAQRDGYRRARTEPLITLGSAPLEVPEFRSVVLGQLGESRLIAAIDTDLAGATSHARALDADTTGLLRDLHRRVGTAILFESSGGQVDRVAHLPELRFALGEPGIDTTSIDTAALALESKGFFLRRVGSDGLRIGHQPTLKKVVSDRRASLDEELEIKPAIRNCVQREFDRGAQVPLITFPEDGASIPDSPRLVVVVASHEEEWINTGTLRSKLAEWTRQRGQAARLYPGSLIWCVRKPGRELREKAGTFLAWRRVEGDILAGVLGSEFDRSDRAEIHTHVSDAEESLKDEVWASYRYLVLSDSAEPDGLKVVDLGAGHASASETLTGRVLQALRSSALLNESVGAGYIERNWPAAFRETEAWPLSSLRQCFLNGALTRLVDPDKVLRGKIMEFVGKGDFGLASGPKPGGCYDRVWFQELLSPDEVSFESGVVLLKKSRAQALREAKDIAAPGSTDTATTLPERGGAGLFDERPKPVVAEVEAAELRAAPRVVRVNGNIPSEVWNRLGTRLLPKLKAGADFTAGVTFAATFDATAAAEVIADLRQAISDLGLDGKITVTG